MVPSHPDSPGEHHAARTDSRAHDNASELDRGAYNQAFSELGLEWYWDSPHVREPQDLRRRQGLRPGLHRRSPAAPAPGIRQPVPGRSDRERAAPPERRRAALALELKHATLRQLKVFESVARHLSFSRAAEELHLTQPAVSTQVKKLEEHAGLALFEQFGKKIYLTAGRRRAAAASAARSSSSSRTPKKRWRSSRASRAAG